MSLDTLQQFGNVSVNAGTVLIVSVTECISGGVEDARHMFDHVLLAGGRLNIQVTFACGVSGALPRQLSPQSEGKAETESRRARIVTLRPTHRAAFPRCSVACRARQVCR